MPSLPVIRLHPYAQLPDRAHEGDAGYDLTAAEDVLLAPGGGRAAVGTGVAVAIPVGHAGLVVPRSGLAAKHGISVVNAPGLIDSGYRGELKVIMVNTDPVEPFQVSVGDRIAQLVLTQVQTPELVEVDELPDSHDGRGVGGLGSSGGFVGA